MNGSQRSLASLTWRPTSLQMPIIREQGDSAGDSAQISRESAIVGPQTHRLPFRVMWGINLLTALGVALANFGMILVIQSLVRLKFDRMQYSMNMSGVTSGILTLVLVSASYAVVGVCLIQFLAPNCGGSGIPENKTYLNGGDMQGLFTKRTLVVRMATNVLANAAGFPVGREGPMVTIGSNFAFLLSKRLARPFLREWVDVSGQGGNAQAMLIDEQRLSHATRISCTVGGACAIAVIFNAPFGGLLYMFEEVTSIAWPLELTFRVFVATMLCSLLSYGLCYLVGSDMTEFVIYAETPQDKKWAWSDIPIFIVLAALLGMLTSLHTRGMLAMAHVRQSARVTFARLQPWATICETAAYAAVCALAASIVSLAGVCTKEGESGLEYVAFNCPQGEYNPIASLLVATSHSSVKLLFSGNNAGEIRWTSSMLAFLTYSMLNIGLAGLPVPGGAFTATMLMGGLFGRSLGALCGDLGLSSTVSGVYAVVGSAAMLCGFKQMTLASVIIVVECVNDLSLAPVVMLGVAVSMAVNWNMNERGHDEEVIHRKHLPFLEGDPPHGLDSAVALNVCDLIPVEAILPPEASSSQIQQALEEHQLNYFPVRDGESGPCIGIVLRSHLEALLRAARTPGLYREEQIFLDTDLCTGMSAVLDAEVRDAERLPVHRIMDPTPFAIVEDMPAPRLYALFSKAGERAACVTSIRGEFRGILSRESLIAAARRSW